MFITFPLGETKRQASAQAWYTFKCIQASVYIKIRNLLATSPTRLSDVLRRIQWSVIETTQWIKVLVNMIKDRVLKTGEGTKGSSLLAQGTKMNGISSNPDRIHPPPTYQPAGAIFFTLFLRLFLPHRLLLLSTSRRIVGDYPTAREIFIPAPIFSSISSIDELRSNGWVMFPR